MASEKDSDNGSKVVDLLRYLVAIEFAKGGLRQTEIAKRLGVATSKVNQMLKGTDLTKRKNGG